MLPRFPPRLRRIDAALLADHCRLAADDHCEFLWEYVPHRPADWTAVNQLIRDLKLKRSELARQPARLRHKQAAIAHAARALRRLLPPASLREITFVPMPCSQARGGCDHDDRLLRVLRRAFPGRMADVRELLAVRSSTAADHERRVRLSPAELRGLLCLDPEPDGEADAVRDAPDGPRPVIVLVDDVLNSGKHYRVASALLRQRWPHCRVRGLFLARCVRESPPGTVRPGRTPAPRAAGSPPPVLRRP